MIYHFRFVSSAHHSELLPSDLEDDVRIVKDLISKKLVGRTPLMIVQSVRVEFLFTEYHYILYIAIARQGKIANNEADMEPYVEGLVAEALLQLFGDGVSVF